MPCQDCLSQIKKIGFKFLYTIQNNEIKKIKIKELTTSYMTVAQKNYKKNNIL